MARRKRRWRPIGQWLRTARKGSLLTLAELAGLTGISSSALGRFESNRAIPSVDDVCVISQQLGWPLLYLTTGRERTGNDPAALVSELYYWGLRDVSLPERVLFGEVRSFENLVAEVLGGEVSGRILEAVPALLLRNRLETSELISQGRQYGNLRRLGWLADVAQTISSGIPLQYLHPEATRWLRTVVKSAKSERAPKEIDYVLASAANSSGKQAWAASPPLTRRWRIACDITLRQFAARALSLLERARPS